MIALPDVFLERPIAHRGLHDRSAGVIENSRAAVIAAVEAGYGIEIDLQLSADGEAMVFHDHDLDRLTDEIGPVAERSAVELGRIALKDSDETIPTFAEALDAVRGRAPILVEIKDQSRGKGPVDGRLERRAARLLSAYEGPAAFMSFNPFSVAASRDAAPDVPRGRVTCSFSAEEWPSMPRPAAEALAAISDLDALGAGFISHAHAELDCDPVARARAAGRKILCWTTRSAAEDAAARRFADNVTFEGYRP